ncbi:MAG TPA: rhomboid family intramembrane serine protease [Mucilaginibacter sp.]|jgi:TonB-dependent SusC/RagA subfamily outer membrane receptor
MDMFSVDEDIINFFAPMALTFIPILIWLRPRIKLLNLKAKKGDPLMGYIMFAWMGMLAPVVVAQAYLITATGEITRVNNISKIDELPKTKYYSANHFYVDKKLVRFKTKFEVSGKYNADFDMYIYAAVPVYDKNHTTKTYNFKISSPHSNVNSNNALIVLNGRIVTGGDLSNINPKSIKSISVLKGNAAVAIYGDAAKTGAILITTKSYQVPDTLASIRDDNVHYAPSAWIGVRYEKTIRNKLSPEKKQAAYEEFATESQRDFNSKPLDKFIYLDRIGTSKDLKNYIAAVTAKGDSLNDPVIVLSPVNEPFEARNGQKLPWIFGSFAIGAVIFMITLLFKPLKDDASEAGIEKSDADEKSSTLKDFKSFFLPRKGFYVTPIIIDLNLLVFIAMVCSGLGFISFNGMDLLKWGANYRPLVNKGEYWRLLTNTFLHGGLMHVLLNMYGLFFVGIFLEPLMGRSKYATAYICTGIIASIASAWWHPATISVGASGAIFGMYGVFLALLTTSLFPPDFKKSFLVSTSIFVGYNLLYGLTGGIDNAAHIGGLLSGLLIGYGLYPTLKSQANEREAQKETQQYLDELNEK